MNSLPELLSLRKNLEAARHTLHLGSLDFVEDIIQIQQASPPQLAFSFLNSDRSPLNLVKPNQHASFASYLAPLYQLFPESLLSSDQKKTSLI